tara:strand:+ start:1865 stop:2011 length:147 start_codon:yes stop_codon:yes gene_type:complete
MIIPFQLVQAPYTLEDGKNQEITQRAFITRTAKNVKGAKFGKGSNRRF